jgi:hypothetical protein
MATTYKHASAAGAGSKDGSDWSNAYDWPALKTFLEGSVVADTVIWYKGGSTTTLTASLDSNLRDGSSTGPIAIIGVKSATTNTGSSVTYSDWARSVSDMPFFDISTYQFRVGDSYILRNLNFQGEASNAVYPGAGCIVENCKFDQDYGTNGSRYMVYTGSYCKVVGCEFLGSKNAGLNIGQYGVVYKCNFHDLRYGMSFGSIGILAVGCIFANCSVTGCVVGSNGTNGILGCTFYECTVGVDKNEQSYWNIFTDNIMEGNNTSGFVGGSVLVNTDLYWSNHGNDARCNDMWVNVDVTGPFQDYLVSTGDPKFVNVSAGSEDFRLQSSSPCINTGIDAPWYSGNNEKGALSYNATGGGGGRPAFGDRTGGKF